MEVVIVPSAEEGARVAADMVVAGLARRSDPVIGLATGSSPRGIYSELSAKVSAGTLSLASASAFLLDEYVGLPAGHPASYRAEIEQTFVSLVDIPSDRVHGPDGTADDIPAACDAYEQAIRDAGGVDVQILGVGSDGHIAFNEPGSSLASRTRIKTLTEQTRVDNARFFGGELDAVPHHCLTQGVGTIMAARTIVLVGFGAGKAEAIRETVEGPISARWPATALQWHPQVKVVIDEAAAARLELRDYYREVREHKPSWQHL